MAAPPAGTTCMYREVHPPTAVTHAASGFITRPGGVGTQPDLVVCRGTAVSIYQLRTAHAGKAGRPPTARLEHLASYTLSGEVESLAVLRSRAVDQRDAVLLTFRDAKLSVLEWDVASHQLSVTSLHSFEGEPSLRRSKKVFAVGPRVLTDPAGRLAVVVMFDHQLAVLPAVEADYFLRARLAAAPAPAAAPPQLLLTAGGAPTPAAGGAAPGAGGSTALTRVGGAGSHSAVGAATAGPRGADLAAPGQLGGAAAVGNSYVLDLSHIGSTEGVVDLWQGDTPGVSGAGVGPGMGRARGAPDARASRTRLPSASPGTGAIQEVRDAVFLHGYHEPVLLVLHQPEPTWAGQYRDRKDCCVVSALSLSVRRKKHTVLWSGAGLPADSLRLVAVPHRPLALVLTPCAVLLVQQGNQYGVLVSSYGQPGPAVQRVEVETLIQGLPGAEQPYQVAAKVAQECVDSVAPETLPGMYRNMPRVPGVDADLRGATATWVGDEWCLLSCAGGLQLGVKLRAEGPVHQRIQVHKVEVRPTPPPPGSCAADLGGGCVFLGSAVGDSLVLKHHHTRPPPAANGGDRPAKRAKREASAGDQPVPDGAAPADPPPPGQQDGKVEDVPLAKQGDEEGGQEEEEEDEDGGEDEANASGLILGKDLGLRVVDSLPNVGPTRDVLHVDTSAAVQRGSAGGALAGTRGGPTVFTASGGERGSALLQLRPGLVPEVVTEVALNGITGLWAVHYRRDEVVASAPAPDDAGPGALVPIAAPGGQTGDGGARPHHAFLLLTHGSGRTMVLETGEQLEEVTETSSFVTELPTLSAGNLFNLAGICQVVPTGVFAFDGTELLQELLVTELTAAVPTAGPTAVPTAGPPPSDARIVWAQVCDPYVVVRLSTGGAAVLAGDEISMTLQVSDVAASVLSTASTAQDGHGGTVGVPVTAACVYHDSTGWLSACLGTSHAAPPANPTPEAPVVKPEPGTGPEEGTGAGAGPQPPQPPAEGVLPQPGVHFLLVAFQDGRLHIYRLPNMERVFQTSHAGSGTDVLAWREEGDAPVAGPGVPGPVRITELRVESFPESTTSATTGGGLPECERPVLVALTATGALLCYQAFDRGGGAGGTATGARVAVKGEQGGGIAGAGDEGQDSSPAAGGQRLGWRRLPVDWVSHQDAAPATAAVGGGPIPRLSRFEGLASLSPDDSSTGTPYSGVFVSGARPMWLVAARGGLVPHPMTIDGPVLALTPFHNVNCPHGFVMSCAAGMLKVCHLPHRERLDTPWATRKVKVPGGGVLHRLAHLRDVNLLALAATRQLRTRARLPEEPGSDPHAAAAYAGAAALAQKRGHEEGVEVLLLQLPQLSPAPGLRPILCAPGEGVRSMRQVTLKEGAHPDAPTHTLLAVGTDFMLGEDYPCLGRIALYRLTSRQKPGVGVEWSSAQVCSRPTTGPVTSLLEFRGMLLAGVGKSVELYSLRPARSTPAPTPAPTPGQPAPPPTPQYEVVKVGFYDCSVLINSLSLVKDFILVGDAHAGCTFLQYKEATRIIDLLGRDWEPQETTTAGFVINAPKLLFASADAAGTLRQAEYVRNHAASMGGKRLMGAGSLHIGHLVTCMTGFKLATPDAANRHGLLVATASGSWGCWAPVWEVEAARRLSALQKHMVHALHHPVGLNPRAFRRRYLHTPRALGGGERLGPQLAPEQVGAPRDAPSHLYPFTNGAILDGDLLWRFAELPRGQQQALVSLAGAVTVEQVLLDLTAWAVATTL